MGIKSDKTFEEIVERLVTLFRPERRDDGDSDAGPGVSSSDIAIERTPSTPVPASPAQDDTQN